jgi:hypothetical protein
LTGRAALQGAIADGLPHLEDLPQITVGVLVFIFIYWHLKIFLKKNLERALVGWHIIGVAASSHTYHTMQCAFGHVSNIDLAVNW